MNRALPLALLVSAVMVSSVRACVKGSLGCSASSSSSVIGGAGNVNSPVYGGTAGAINANAATLQPVYTLTNAAPTVNAINTADKIKVEALCVTNPAICANLVKNLNDNANSNTNSNTNSNSNSNPSAGAGGPYVPGGGSSDVSAQRQAVATAKANGANVAGANANWSPEDLAKLQGANTGAPSGAIDPGAEQRTAMLAAMLASPHAPLTPGKDPFGKGVVTDLSASAAGAPRDRAADLLGSALNKLKMGDSMGALRDANQAIALDPGNPVGYLRTSEAYNHLGQWADAERMAREAVSRDDKSAQAWKNLAWALLKQGKYQDALAAALKAAALKPDMAEAWAIASFAAERLHDAGARLSYLSKAAAFDPRFQARLDAVNAGGNAYADDDDMLVGAAADRAKGWNVPLAAAGAGAAGGLAALAMAGAWLWRRKRSAAAVAHTILELRPSTPAAPRAPRMEAPSGAGAVVGKYELGQLIGRGGMGEVFEAKDLSLGRSVAIKKMTAAFSELGSQARGLFLKEARTVAQLHHPAIVDIYEILEDGTDLYLVFEHVKGKTTQQLLAEAGRLPLPRAAEILKPVCEALQFAHGRSMVHRDLKPANIMLTEQGHVKLMDFGIARSLLDAVETQFGARIGNVTAIGSARTATVVGTPVYMPPEAELGVVCKEGDVYSLGVTLY